MTYDNLRTAVAKILKGRNRQEQEAFTRFRGEFPFEANFAAPRKGNEKGKVENAVKYIRAHAFASHTEFKSLQAANTHLRDWLWSRDAKRVHSTHKQVIRDRYQLERGHLKPLPKPMPPCCRVVYAVVSKFSFVQFETNRYSVPTPHVAETVMIKAFESRLLIFKADKVIAKHQRRYTRHQEVINPYHFLALLEQKARAVDHAVVMDSLDLDPVLYQLKEELCGVVENPNRAWIKILRLTEQYPMEMLVQAVKTAIAHGVCDYASIVNLLIQQVKPFVSVEAENRLAGHGELLTLTIPPPTLTGYDALLAGEGDQ